MGHVCCTAASPRQRRYESKSQSMLPNDPPRGMDVTIRRDSSLAASGRKRITCIPMEVKDMSVGQEALCGSPLPEQTSSQTPSGREWCNEKGTDESREAAKKRLKVFFLLNNPEKVPEIDRLVDKYDGMYSDLYKALESKYDAPTGFFATCTADTVSNTGSFALPSASADSSSTLSVASLTSNVVSVASVSPPLADELAHATQEHASVRSPSPTTHSSSRHARQLLLSFFKKVNPEKLSDVDRLVEKYEGMYEDLYIALESKYHVPINESRTTDSPVADDAKRIDLNDDCCVSSKPDRPISLPNAKRQLVAFFERVNPEKLSDVDRLVEKYEGMYDDLYIALRQKYGEEIALVSEQNE